MFYKYQDMALVLRLVESTDDYKRKSYVSTEVSYQWHLKALSISQTLENWDFGKTYKFTTETTADIREWDRLTINGSDYDVKWAVQCKWITFSSLQCLIIKLW